MTKNQQKVDCKIKPNTRIGALLPQTVKTIVFYGHSFAPADYSYFQSIFDYYNIYDNDITLVFYYSIYGSGANFPR